MLQIESKNLLVGAAARPRELQIRRASKSKSQIPLFCPASASVSWLIKFPKGKFCDKHKEPTEDHDVRKHRNLICTRLLFARRHFDAERVPLAILKITRSKCESKTCLRAWERRELPGDARRRRIWFLANEMAPEACSRNGRVYKAEMYLSLESLRTIIFTFASRLDLIR